MSASPSFDLDAYLERLGHLGARDPGVSTLGAVHVAHLGSIPFENVDVRLGRTIDLGLDAVQEKLVYRRRGGYCFEQNTLLAAALRAMGFGVETLEARVRPPGATSVLPRTHMILRVEAGGSSWIADVGFGGDGPLVPVPLDGSVCAPPDCGCRIETEPGGVRVMRRLRNGAWRDLYAFTLSPALPVDYEVASHYTSTHPSSVFVKTLTVQRATPRERHILRDLSYTIRRGDEDTVQEVPPGEVPSLLRRRFGLDLPDRDVLRALGAAPET